VADPTLFVDANFGVSIAGLLGGNPNLQEETGETTTLGIVLRPSLVEGLILSADWYDITISNAINTPTAQNIANQCVDLPTIVNEFCDLIDREIGGPDAGTILGFTTIPVNVASFRTRGIDFTARYTLDPQRFGFERDIGTFTFNLVGNHLDTSEFVNLAGAAPDQDLGEIGVPEWQVNFDLTWRYGPFLLNYGYNYFSETSRFSDTQMQAQPDDLAPDNLLWYDERSTHDLQARWEITDSVALYGGVNNMFNQEPDQYSEAWPVDPVGRFFYIGFAASVDSLTEPRR
jgi:outer membrane receptor protein involved in Fe transport